MAVLLIAEDEKDMQNIIVDFMKRGGHSCILANDGVEALSILENNTVDLIILGQHRINAKNRIIQWVPNENCE